MHAPLVASKRSDIMTRETHIRPSRVPVDRGWAWVVVLGTFGNMALVVGTLKSFGVLLVELSHRYNAPASVLASSQSLCGWLHLGLAPVSNNLSQRFSYRRVVFFGGVLSTLGLIATGFVTEIEWFFVTYGVMTGIGFGLAFGPTTVFPGLYLDKKLPLGLGLSAAGSGLGSFIFPNLMRYLMDEYSVSGCLLVMGGIVLHVCLFALLLRPLTYWETGNDTTVEEHYTENEDKWTSDVEMQIQDEESKKLLTVNKGSLNDIWKTGTDSGSTTKPGLSRTQSLTWFSNVINKQGMTSSYSDNSVYFEKKKVDLKFSKRNSKQRVEAVEDLRKPPNPSFINWKMLTDPLFILVTIGVFLAIFAHHIIFNFIPPLADEFGFTESEGALCVSIVGFTDLIGRASSGVIGNAFFTRRIKLYIICLLVFATCTMIVIHVTNVYIFIVFCCLIGLSTGGYVGVKLSMIADELGKENLPTAWGYIAFFSSFSILINPVISGAIKDSSGSWVNAFRMSSVSGFLSAAVLFTVPYVRKCLEKKRQRS